MNLVLLSDHMWFAVMDEKQATEFILDYTWKADIKDRYGIYIDGTTGERKVIRP